MTMIGEAFLRVRPDTTTFRGETARGVRGALSGLGFTGGVAAVGLGAVGGAALIAGAAMAGAVDQAATLQQSLDVFEATAQATAAEMEQVSKKARELGADLSLPAVSAGDAANAMTQLAKGGLSVVDTLQGAKGVLQLAAAAELEVAAAADITANALNAFQLPGTQAVRVADLLAGASIAASGDIDQMAQALQQSAAVAHQAGLGIDELTALITALAKRGIQGSDAGTSIRTTLLRLIPTTKEAQEVVDALGISVADQEGNFRSVFDIFEQYRNQLAQLDPVTRQAALSTIFGSDAIRAATVFADEGAEGLKGYRDAVDQAGTAQRLAEARTEGLKGQFSGLVSQVETLGATVGQVFIPALEGVVGAASITVGALNDLAGAFVSVTDSIGRAIGAGLFEFYDKFAKPVGKHLGEAAFDAAQGIAALAGQQDNFALGVDSILNPPRGTSTIPDIARDAAQDAKKAVTDAIRPVPGLIENELRRVDPALERRARESGERYSSHVAAGILANAREAVHAAEQTLAETIRAGNEAIDDAAAQAKVNLRTIGNQLADQAAQLIDAGPLGRRIRALQDQLSSVGDRRERGRLTRDLRDATEELADARRQVATAAGARTPEQQRAVDEFLRPFVEKVQDAKAALGEFNTEGIVERLQAQAEQQKRTVVEGIQEVVAAFNTGRINAAQANAQIARVLGEAIPDYRKAGAGLGTALREGFNEALQGLQQQITEIVRGPQTSRTGFEVEVVSPNEAAARAAGETAAARVALEDARRSLQDTLMAQANDKLQQQLRKAEEALAEEKTQTSLLGDISRQLGGRGGTTTPKKGSSQVELFGDKKGGR